MSNWDHYNGKKWWMIGIKLTNEKLTAVVGADEDSS